MNLHIVCVNEELFQEVSRKIVSIPKWQSLIHGFLQHTWTRSGSWHHLEEL